MFLTSFVSSALQQDKEKVVNRFKNDQPIQPLTDLLDCDRVISHPGIRRLR